MNFEENTIKENQLPQFLKVLCILTFIGTGLGILFNIFGFLNLQRELPDGRDLNRSFPGSNNGSLAAQFAFHFMKEIAPHCDYIIDFHTGAAQRNNFPQIRCVFSDQESVELAKVFNPPVLRFCISTLAAARSHCWSV